MKAFIVTGDRYANDEEWRTAVKDALYDYKGGAKVLCIHGDARGIDTIAAQWCEGHQIDTIPMPYIASQGKAGGPVRNQAMLRVLLSLQEVGYSVRVHAFHNSIETSKGTKNMVGLAERAGIPVDIHRNGSRKDAA